MENPGKTTAGLKNLEGPRAKRVPHCRCVMRPAARLRNHLPGLSGCASAVDCQGRAGRAFNFSL